jgi:hypothetical protein
MKKLIVIVLATTSCGISNGQDTMNRGFEIGPNLVTFSRPFFSYAGDFYSSSVAFFNGAQLTYNIGKFALRSQYRFNSEYIVNDYSGQSPPPGTSYHYYKMKQLKFGGQYYFKKKIRKLYSYLDITGEILRGRGNGHSGWGGTAGDYSYKSKLNGIGFDIGLGYKIRVYGNFSVAVELGLNTDYGRYRTEKLYYNDHKRIETYARQNLNTSLEGRLVLAVKIK